MIILDTNIAIRLRDRDPGVAERFAALAGPAGFSVVTRIELENGLHGDASGVAARRRGIDLLASEIPTLFLDEADIRTYRSVVAMHGKGGTRTSDWMIAAQAIARNATLVTRNGRDFRMIDGLKLAEW